MEPPRASTRAWLGQHPVDDSRLRGLASTLLDASGKCNLGFFFFFSELRQFHYSYMLSVRWPSSSFLGSTAEPPPWCFHTKTTSPSAGGCVDTLEDHKRPWFFEKNSKASIQGIGLYFSLYYSGAAHGRTKIIGKIISEPRTLVYLFIEK